MSTRGGIFSVLTRTAAAAAYPGGPRTRLPILAYHRVPERHDPMLPDTLDAGILARHFDVLSRYFNVLPLDEAVEMAEQGVLPARAAAITFDDGYRDNCEVGLPILRKYGLPATIYIATSFLDGGRMFCDTTIEFARRLPSGEIDLSSMGLGRRQVSDAASRVKLADELNDQVKFQSIDEREESCRRLESMLGERLPDYLMMSSEQVAEIVKYGITVGGHTENHPNLAHLDREAATREIVVNRSKLSALTGKAPRSFAYPFGWPDAHYTTATVDVVRAAGYRSAVTMSWGVSRFDRNRYQLPRFSPTERSSGAFLRRMLKMAMHHTPRLAAGSEESGAAASSPQISSH